MKQLLTYVVCVLMVELCGFGVGMMTRDGTAIYRDTIAKPPLSPAPTAFPIAWTILYALMGIGLARIIMKETSGVRTAAIALFAAQLVFNLAWCFIFFKAQRFGIAFIWLLVMFILVVLMFLNFRKLDAIAANIQVPYMIWLVFAGYLNLGVWILNR